MRRRYGQIYLALASVIPQNKLLLPVIGSVCYRTMLNCIIQSRMKWCNIKLCYVILSFDFCGMVHLYLSYHLWSDMHLNHTSFVFWLFSSLNDLFFLHCNWYLWRKNSTATSEYMSHVTILHWVIYYLLLFLLGRKRCIYTPVLLYFSSSFLRQYRLLEMNQIESWVYLQIGKL